MFRTRRRMSMTAGRVLRLLVLHVTCAALGAICTGACGMAAAQERPTWWDVRWSYRKLVNVERRGPNRLWIHLRRGADSGGGDLRVVGPEGEALPFGVIHSRPEGRYLLSFRAASTEGFHGVYFGNSAAGAVENGAPSEGLVLETLAIPRGVGAGDWQQARQAIARASEVYGADFVPNVWHAQNPFGPQENYIAIYRGYLRCPRQGEYGFATVSDHSSFLLVEDELVASWPGPHNIWQGRRGEHSGRIVLPQGRHRFTYIHFAFGQARRCAAAWMPPGQDWWRIIPPGAFGMPAEASVIECEQLGHALCADFAWSPDSYLEVGKAQLVKLRFESTSTATDSIVADYRWQFGDGQSASGWRAEHVYLTPGRRSVSLQVSTQDGRSASCAKSIEVAPIWDDLDFTDQKQQEALALARGYDLERLPDSDLLAAWRFFLDAESAEDAFAAATALDRRRDSFGPDDVHALAMYLAQRYRARGSPAMAEQYLRVAANAVGADDRRRFDARLMLADLWLHEMGRAAEARQEYERIRQELANADAEQRRRALVGIGDAWRRQGNDAEAREAYATAEAKGGFAPAGPRYLLRSAALQQAESHLNSGEADLAEERLDDLTWWFPTLWLSGHVLRLRAEIELIRGDFRAARREAESAIAVVRDANHRPSLHALAAEACMELGLLEEAAQHYRAVLEDFPEAPEVLEAEAALRRLGR